MAAGHNAWGRALDSPGFDHRLEIEDVVHNVVNYRGTPGQFRFYGDHQSSCGGHQNCAYLSRKSESGGLRYRWECAQSADHCSGDCQRACGHFE